jgi:hypothetical protein
MKNAHAYAHAYTQLLNIKVVVISLKQEYGHP